MKLSKRVQRTALRLLTVALLATTFLTGCSDGDRSNRPTSEARLEALRSALAENPDDPALNLEYGKLLLASGQPSLAVWSLEKASRDEVHEVEAREFLARAQLAVGSHGDAIDTLAAALELDPDAIELIRLAVRANLDARRHEVALEMVDEGLSLEPDDLPLLMSRMRVLLLLDRGDETVAVIAQIRERIGTLDNLPPARKRFVEGQYCATEAMFTHEHGDSQAASELFSACLEEHASHPLVVSSASDFFDEIGRPEAATEARKGALEADPSNLMFRVNLATRLNDLGDREAAEALLYEVTDRQPAVWPALFDFYNEGGERAKALGALEKSIETTGDAAPEEWKLLRADLLVQLGRLDEAEASIEAIHADVYESVARGRLALARGNPAKALAHLESGLRLWPDGTMARYLAAQAAEQLGDFNRAEQEYREAYRSDQTHTDAGLQLADLLASRGLTSDAADLAAAYTVANPDEPRGYEETIGYALTAQRPKMARSALAAYRNRPALRGRAAAFSARYIFDTNGAEDALELISATPLDLSAPENIDLLRVQSDVLFARGEYQKAIDQLARIQGNASPPRSDLADLVASILERQGRTEEARQTYLENLQREPDRAQTLRALGRLERASGRLDLAVGYLDRAAAVDEDDWQSALAAALLVESPGERKKRLQKVLRRNPRSGAAASELGRLLQASGGSPETILDMERRALRFKDDSSSVSP